MKNRIVTLILVTALVMAMVPVAAFGKYEISPSMTISTVRFELTNVVKVFEFLADSDDDTVVFSQIVVREDATIQYYEQPGRSELIYQSFSNLKVHDAPSDGGLSPTPLLTYETTGIGHAYQAIEPTQVVPLLVNMVYTLDEGLDTIFVVDGLTADQIADGNATAYESELGWTPGVENPSPWAPGVEKPSPWAEELVSSAIGVDLVPLLLQSGYLQPISRAEFCALVVKLFERITGEQISARGFFRDTTDENVEKAAAIGVVYGVGDDLFDPDAKLTREQAAVMLSRLSDAAGKPLPESTPTFNDRTRVSEWAESHVGQMQAAGIMGGIGNNIFDPKGVYTREQSIVTVLRLNNFLTEIGHL